MQQGRETKETKENEENKDDVLLQNARWWLHEQLLGACHVHHRHESPGGRVVLQHRPAQRVQPLWALLPALHRLQCTCDQRVESGAPCVRDDACVPSVRSASLPLTTSLPASTSNAVRLSRPPGGSTPHTECAHLDIDTLTCCLPKTIIINFLQSLFCTRPRTPRRRAEGR